MLRRYKLNEEAYGNSVRIIISEGQKNDIPYAIPLLKQININGSKILADRGYNSNKVLKYIHANGAKATIPSKRNAKI